MSKQLAVLKKHVQQGLTTVEYAIAGSLVAVVVIAAFKVLGPRVGQVIQNISGSL